jgi:hypothetical protein
MRSIHQHALAQQCGLQVSDIRPQRILLVGTAADIILQEPGKSSFALFAVVFNIRDDHKYLGLRRAARLQQAQGHIRRLGAFCADLAIAAPDVPAGLDRLDRFSGDLFVALIWRRPPSKSSSPRASRRRCFFRGIRPQPRNISGLLDGQPQSKIKH